MNITNLSHAGLALILQVAVAFCAAFLGFGDVVRCFLLGALLAIGFYFGREVAQHERKAGTPPWWSGFRIHEWSRDALLDFFLPIVATFGTTLLMWVLFR